MKAERNKMVSRREGGRDDKPRVLVTCLKCKVIRGYEVGVRPSYCPDCGAKGSMQVLGTTDGSRVVTK